MLIIVGLGNPGSRYAGNRHNVGFMVADAIQRRHGFSPWRRRFQGEASEGTLGGKRVLLLKPLTYMNESGRAVAEAMRFYKAAPEDVLVIHDELDLAPGKIRMKRGGGHGGNNGLRSVSGTIGDGYRRVRIGVGHPGHKELVQKHLLSDFAKADAAWLDPLIETLAAEAPLLATGDDANFANRVHLALGGGKAEAAPPDAGAKRPQAAPAGEKPAESALARGLRKLFGGD